MICFYAVGLQVAYSTVCFDNISKCFFVLYICSNYLNVILNTEYYWTWRLGLKLSACIVTLYIGLRHVFENIIALRFCRFCSQITVAPCNLYPQRYLGLVWDFSSSCPRSFLPYFLLLFCYHFDVCFFSCFTLVVLVREVYALCWVHTSIVHGIPVPCRPYYLISCISVIWNDFVLPKYGFKIYIIILM